MKLAFMHKELVVVSCIEHYELVFSMQKKLLVSCVEPCELVWNLFFTWLLHDFCTTYVRNHFLSSLLCFVLSFYSTQIDFVVVQKLINFVVAQKLHQSFVFLHTYS
jgi:hypothetical protein